MRYIKKARTVLKVSIFLLFMLFLSINSYAQIEPRLCIGSEIFIIGLDNRLDLCYPQIEPIKKSDVTATFSSYYSTSYREIEITEKRGMLFIRPDSIGWIKLSVLTKDGIKTMQLNAKSIKAVSKLSGYGANCPSKIGRGEFKAQLGVFAVIEGYDICGKCEVLGFELIRVSTTGKSEKVINIGGRFSAKSSRIIKKARSGDVYIFRMIQSKCPGAEKPTRLDDMTFDIE